MVLIALVLFTAHSVIVLICNSRTTLAQTTLGTKVSRDELMPGDLVFFKTGSGQNGLHVGIYDTNDEFIHASTSKGVIRSSLENVYWKRVYWQARRI